MSVGNERRNVVVWLRGSVRGGLRGKKWGEWEEIAASCWTMGDESEDFGDEALLDGCFELGVEFRETGLPCVIED